MIRIIYIEHRNVFIQNSSKSRGAQRMMGINYADNVRASSGGPPAWYLFFHSFYLFFAAAAGFFIAHHTLDSSEALFIVGSVANVVEPQKPNDLYIERRQIVTYALFN